MIKKITNFLLDLIFIILMVSAFSFLFSQGIKPLFNSNSYTYKTLPEPYKQIIEEFVQESNLRNLDVSKVYKIKFTLVHDEKLHWGGYSNGITNSIFLNTATDIGAIRFVLWHELGHGVLNYGHDMRPITSHIMNSGRSKDIYVSWNERKAQFFNEPMPRNYIKNTIHSIYTNNYLLGYISQTSKDLYSKIVN